MEFLFFLRETPIPRFPYGKGKFSFPKAGASSLFSRGKRKILVFLKEEGIPGFLEEEVGSCFS